MDYAGPRELEARFANIKMTTPNIQYAYASGSSNTIRPTSVTYPNGRVITFDYGTAGGINDQASRVESIKDGSMVLAQYSYLGLGAPVVDDINALA